MYLIQTDRQGKPDARGLYWRPNGEGYTDDVMEAGLFPERHPAVARVQFSFRSRLVPVGAAVVDEMLRRAEAAAARVPELRQLRDALVGAERAA
ncbi:MAG: hypothetical protein Q8Q14_12280 [Gemmatimonadales bacterium]|nr:hypothetical protein [Gemmatimonadales bacterium]